LRRTVLLRLVPDEEAGARLRALCSLSSKLWNEINYAERRMFFKEKGRSKANIYRELYDMRGIKLIGSATALRF
jgi:putative transposase